MISMILPDTLHHVFDLNSGIVLVALLKESDCEYLSQISVLESIAKQYQNNVNVFIAEENQLDFFFNTLSTKEYPLSQGTPQFIVFYQGIESTRFIGNAEEIDLINMISTIHSPY